MTIFDRSGYDPKSGPIYHALAAAIEDHVKSGRWPAGTQLPPQRDLAHDLGVTVGTVGRAYAILQSRGLISGEVGRGSFVRGPRSPGRNAGHDLRRNLPPDIGQAAMMSAALTKLTRQGFPQSWANYASAAALAELRTAGASFMRKAIGEIEADNLLVTSGAQQAIFTALSSVAKAGEKVAVEAECFHGITRACRLLGIEIEAVPVDPERGMDPEELDRLAARVPLRAVVVVPNFHNPTGAVMPLADRRRIAELARARNFAIIEDDVYGPLAASPPPPVQSFAPERSLFVTSLSKCFTPGLRIGFLALPDSLIDPAEKSLASQYLDIPPMMGALAAELLRNGAVADCMTRIGDVLERRQALARRILNLRDQPSRSPHLYVPVPPPRRATQIAEACIRAGVDIYGPEYFASGGTRPGGIRLSLGVVPNDEDLVEPLTLIAEILTRPPAKDAPVI